MFFGYSDEEKMLQKSVRDMLKERNSTEYVRGFMENPVISADLQKLLAQQGLLGIIDLDSKEEKGIVNAIIVSQEAGRSLLTYPLLESMVGLAVLKESKQQEQLVEDLELGKKILTVAWVNTDVKARKTEEGYVINGTLREVPFAEDADVIIANVRISGYGVTAEEEETLVIIDGKNQAVTKLNSQSVDETYPLYEINLANYPLQENHLIGKAGMGSGKEKMEKMRQLGSLLLAAEIVGCSERALYETVEYTKQREQFGTVIGSFQALKHMAAEMYMKVESGKVAVDYAAWTLDTENDEVEEAVAIAKSYASSAGIEICGNAIQMHGGIGFTWENDTHLFFKRVRRSAALLGDSYECREKLAKIAIDQLLNKGKKITTESKVEYVEI
ncbi:MAG: acyl-CoA dehydrogenase family protein [Bacillus sp. (in: firmicutes)]